MLPGKVLQQSGNAHATPAEPADDGVQFVPHILTDEHRLAVPDLRMVRYVSRYSSSEALRCLPLVLLLTGSSSSMPSMLIDGIDGLASGLCSVACLFYGLTFFMLHQHVYAILAFATLGVLVPFFYYNVFGNAKHGRKIFMGDTGSLTIGMMLCFLSLKLTMCGLDDNTGNVHPMVLAFSPLLVPCCDVVRVYLHRVRNGKNPFLPDKNHIHHKLLALGIKQRNAMIIIVSVSTIFILLNILLSLYLNVNWIVLGDILIWTLANIRLTKSIGQLQSEQKTNK